MKIGSQTPAAARNCWNLWRRLAGARGMCWASRSIWGGCWCWRGTRRVWPRLRPQSPPCRAAFRCGWPIMRAFTPAFRSRWLRRDVGGVCLARVGRPRSRGVTGGGGAMWGPKATDTAALWDYTLGHQVVEPYDFTRAIRTAAREFAPDMFIVTGPGTTLGGAVAQSLILSDWQGMGSKADFQQRQAASPLLVSMGMADQRGLVV